MTFPNGLSKPKPKKHIPRPPLLSITDFAEEIGINHQTLRNQLNHPDCTIRPVDKKNGFGKNETRCCLQCL